MFEIKTTSNAKCSPIKYPILLIPITVLVGSTVYGLIFLTLNYYFPMNDGDSTAWAALLFGFFELFLIPHSVELSLTESEFLTLVFFVHGAIAGLIAGMISAFVIYWKNFPTDTTKQ